MTTITSRKTFREKRHEVYDNLFSANILCVMGLLSMPALLFNPNTVSRVFQFLFFWFLAWLSGRKNNPIITIAVIISITFFNLLVPYGRVLFTIGAFKITETALLTGIRRAVTLEGLIMLSKVSIRHDLKIPGAFGELLGESLRISSELMNRKYRISPKTIIADLDNLMIELSNDTEVITHNVNVKTKPSAFIIVAAVVVVSWAICVYLLLFS